MLICLVKERSPNRCGPFGGDVVHLLASAKARWQDIKYYLGYSQALHISRKGGRQRLHPINHPFKEAEIGKHLINLCHRARRSKALTCVFMQPHASRQLQQAEGWDSLRKKESVESNLQLA